ncbi:FAD-dependent monooxygenase [Streptomyces sp. NPDC048473]|uniref:FAD-dependent monooxygenase n=1 Tax=unclassified Streptomyces TaxID=2593676 RepID=UPI00371472C5
MDTRNTRRALVVGLGISGIATALRLRQIGWEPVIVERAPARRSFGYFVGLFGTGRTAAARLGILDHLEDLAVPGGVVYNTDRAGNRRVGLAFGDLAGSTWIVTRAEVEAAAFAALPGDVEIRYATVPSGITQDPDGVDVTLENTLDGSTATERFDLVVGADGMRSTVRSLVFGPHESYLRRLGFMVTSFFASHPLPGLDREDGVILREPGRALWVFPFKDRLPAISTFHRTADVDAEFLQKPAERLRAAFGPAPTGKLLGSALDQFEAAEAALFDSTEQVHLDHWHRGRVVLVGDAAWSMTVFSGMGVSTGIAGPELLGTSLLTYPDDITAALTEWETRLRPFVNYHQKLAQKQRPILAPANRRELLTTSTVTRGLQLPAAGPALSRLKSRSKPIRWKAVDVQDVAA